MRQLGQMMAPPGKDQARMCWFHAVLRAPHSGKRGFRAFLFSTQATGSHPVASDFHE
jgi:hypothetical protein